MSPLRPLPFAPLLLQLGAACLLALLPSPAVAQGGIQVWGTNYQGVASETPGGSDFVQAAAGDTHAVALRRDGSLHSWGDDRRGQVSETPPGTGYTTVEAGGGVSLALRTDGSIASWGWDKFGLVSNAPTGTGFTQVSAGHGGHCIALGADGSLHSWGIQNQSSWDYGQVTNTPTGTGYTFVEASYYNSAALRADGSIDIWGSDHYGLVSYAPTGTGFRQVTLGVYHGLALRSDGSIFSWGLNHGGFGILNTPHGPGFIQVDTDDTHAIALHSDGTLHSWGEDGEVLWSTPPGNGFFDAKAGSSYSLALRRPGVGTSFCFGDGTGSPCPCGAPGVPGAGCNNGLLNGGVTLYSYGTPSITTDSFGMQAGVAAAGAVGILIRADHKVNGGLGIAVSDGLHCIAGRTARTHYIMSMGGNLSFPTFQLEPHGTFSNGPGQPTYYQFWYRDYQGCTANSFNSSNALEVVWAP